MSSSQSSLRLPRLHSQIQTGITCIIFGSTSSSVQFWEHLLFVLSSGSVNLVVLVYYQSICNTQEDKDEKNSNYSKQQVVHVCLRTA